MLIKIGYELEFNVPAPTTILTMLYTQPEVAHVLQFPEHVEVDPRVPIHDFIDTFGNRVGRLVAPAGTLRLFYDNVAVDSGELEPSIEGTELHALEDLPDDVLRFLVPSRYCESDKIAEMAWKEFGQTRPDWSRVKTIVDWAHNRIKFGYQWASPMKSAMEACHEGQGVCRDYMHLAITMLRAMNVPARYATGYLGDIGVPANPAPMDFSAYLEVYLSGRWWAMDARHNVQRIGRIKQAHGRDAADVPLTTSFGPTTLAKFLVWTYQVNP
jgi:transglutaminase-like putative cysteine protease